MISPGARKALVVVGVLVAIVGTVGVVVAAFVLSFDATSATARAAGISERLAWLMPTSVDGAMMVATVVFFVMRALRARAWYPGLVVAVGVVISVCCNGLHATGEGGRVVLTSHERFAVSAIPPAMLALSVHLLVELLAALAASKAPSPAPVKIKTVEPRPRDAGPRATKAPAVPPAPVAPVSLTKRAVVASAPRHASPSSSSDRSEAGEVLVEAETIARLAALRDEYAARAEKFDREAIRREFKVGWKKGQAYLNALNAASTHEETGV